MNKKIMEEIYNKYRPNKKFKYPISGSSKPEGTDINIVLNDFSRMLKEVTVNEFSDYVEHRIKNDEK